MLIDLSLLPKEYKEAIMKGYEKEPNGRSRMFNFFIEKRLQHLLPEIGDF
jgi:hypothetical protein